MSLSLFKRVLMAAFTLIICGLKLRDSSLLTELNPWSPYSRMCIKIRSSFNSLYIYSIYRIYALMPLLKFPKMDISTDLLSLLETFCPTLSHAKFKGSYSFLVGFPTKSHKNGTTANPTPNLDVYLYIF